MVLTREVLHGRRYVKNAETEGQFHEQKRSALEEKKRLLVSTSIMGSIAVRTMGRGHDPACYMGVQYR